MSEQMTLRRGDVVRVRGRGRARVLVPVSRLYCGERIATVAHELGPDSYGNPSALPWCEIVTTEGRA